jgi:hypothetical protein
VNSLSPFGFLQLKWLITVDRLDKLDNQWAHLHQQTDVTKEVRMLITRELMDQRKALTLQRQLIESYLGNDARRIDSRHVEFAKYLDVARWVRASIQNGESDEVIAAWLMEKFPPNNAKRNAGRPQGTIDHSGHALLALELYDSDPKKWSYPKLAHDLLKCEEDGPHNTDCACVDELKKSVGRLRTFLHKLGYEQAGK